MAYGIPCVNCGYIEGAHYEWNKDCYGDIIRKGYEMTLRECPGFE